MVMEYYPGGTLYDRAAAGNVSAEACAELARQMLSAVSYLHHHGIAHRDLKLLNWVLAARDEVPARRSAVVGSSEDILGRGR